MSARVSGTEGYAEAAEALLRNGLRSLSTTVTGRFFI